MKRLGTVIETNSEPGTGEESKAECGAGTEEMAKEAYSINVTAFSDPYNLHTCFYFNWKSEYITSHHIPAIFEFLIRHATFEMRLL